LPVSGPSRSTRSRGCGIAIRICIAVCSQRKAGLLRLRWNVCRRRGRASREGHIEKNSANWKLASATLRMGDGPRRVAPGIGEPGLGLPGDERERKSASAKSRVYRRAERMGLLPQGLGARVARLCGTDPGECGIEKGIHTGSLGNADGET